MTDLKSEYYIAEFETEVSKSIEVFFALYNEYLFILQGRDCGAQVLAKELAKELAKNWQRRV